MEVRWDNEELALRIKAGEKSLLPILWGQCKRTVMILAAKYGGLMRKNAFVDREDFIQCGYFAMLDALQAYDPEKGYKLNSYLKYKYMKQVYKMFGNVRKGGSYIFHDAAYSLNVMVENDGHETELLEMLEDENAGNIEDDYEKKEMQQIVRAAVGKLPEKERYVIQEIYFNERKKTEIVDGKNYKDQFAVTRTEDRAMLLLRKDPSLQALHMAYFKKMPRQQDMYKSSTEKIVIAGESWDKWFEDIMDDIGRFEHGI